MIYNYHTHTYRCGHAFGEIEEYIKRAIDCGIKYMGFSDHAPYICENGEEAGYRVQTANVKDYFDEINALREKYKDKIDIKIGFELEYYPKHFNSMFKNMLEYGAEYLILGEHYTKDELPDGGHVIKETDDTEALKYYVQCIIDGIKSGVFTYIAHPDMFNFTGDVSLYREEMRKICVASRIFDVPLELNLLGIRDKRNYPNNIFWEIAGEEKSPVTFGFDSHEVIDAYDGESIEIAKSIVDKYNLNYIGKPKLVLLKKI